MLVDSLQWPAKSTSHLAGFSQVQLWNPNWRYSSSVDVKFFSGKWWTQSFLEAQPWLGTPESEDAWRFKFLALCQHVRGFPYSKEGQKENFQVSSKSHGKKVRSEATVVLAIAKGQLEACLAWAGSERLQNTWCLWIDPGNAVLSGLSSDILPGRYSSILSYSFGVISICNIFWHPFWRSIWRVFWHAACIDGLYLSYSDILSGVLLSEPGGWGPEGNVLIWDSWLRSGARRRTRRRRSDWHKI